MQSLFISSSNLEREDFQPRRKTKKWPFEVRRMCPKCDFQEPGLIAYQWLLVSARNHRSPHGSYCKNVSYKVDFWRLQSYRDGSTQLIQVTLDKAEKKKCLFIAFKDDVARDFTVHFSAKSGCLNSEIFFIYSRKIKQHCVHNIKSAGKFRE